MSLEDQMAKLTAAIEKQNALTEQLLTKVPAGGAAAETKAADKPAATKPAAETKPADEYAISTTDFMGKIEPFIKEFAKGTPEGDARRAALAETLKKLGAPKVSEITDADKLSKINKWFETKMKGVRLAPDAEPAADADEEL